MRLLATPRFGLSADDLQALAGIAERLNTAQRYRALVSAGIVEADANPSDATSAPPCAPTATKCPTPSS